MPPGHATPPQAHAVPENQQSVLEGTVVSVEKDTLILERQGGMQFRFLADDKAEVDKLAQLKKGTHLKVTFRYIENRMTIEKLEESAGPTPGKS